MYEEMTDWDGHHCYKYCSQLWFLEVCVEQFCWLCCRLEAEDGWVSLIERASHGTRYFVFVSGEWLPAHWRPPLAVCQSKTCSLVETSESHYDPYFSLVSKSLRRSQNIFLVWLPPPLPKTSFWQYRLLSESEMEAETFDILKDLLATIEALEYICEVRQQENWVGLESSDPSGSWIEIFLDWMKTIFCSWVHRRLIQPRRSFLGEHLALFSLQQYHNPHQKNCPRRWHQLILKENLWL